MWEGRSNNHEEDIRLNELFEVIKIILKGSKIKSQYQSLNLKCC